MLNLAGILDSRDLELLLFGDAEEQCPRALRIV